MGYVASLCGSVGNDFVYHKCGHEFDSRLNDDNHKKHRVKCK